MKENRSGLKWMKMIGKTREKLNKKNEEKNDQKGKTGQNITKKITDNSRCNWCICGGENQPEIGLLDF